MSEPAPIAADQVSGAPPVTLAPLRRTDVNRCAEIERVLFPGDDPWHAGAFRAELDSGAYYLGAYDEAGALLGYAGLAVVGRAGDYEAEVHTIGVTPEAQRRGIGRALLVALLARADELDAPVFLEVRTDNEPAITLYREYGFDQIGLRKRYYRPSGADAYTMRRLAHSESPKRATGTAPQVTRGTERGASPPACEAHKGRQG